MPRIRRVRTSQPLEAGLALSFNDLSPIVGVLGSSGTADVVTGARLTASSASRFVASANGVGVNQTAVNTGIYQTGKGYPASSTGYTIVWTGELKGARSGNTPSLIGIAATNTSQSAAIAALEFATTGNDLTINYKVGASFGSKTFSSASPSTGPVTFVAVVDIEKAVCRLSVHTGGQTLQYTSTAISGAAAPTITGSEVFCFGPDVIENPTRYSNSVGCFGVMFEGVTSPEIEADLARNPWQLYEPELIWVPVSAGGGTTYTMSPGGSISLSGNSNQLRTRLQVPSGSITLSGDVPLLRTRLFTTSGNITFGGTAPFSQSNTYTLSPGGTITFSGTGGQVRERVQIATGNITFSGAVALLRTRTMVPTGNITFSGSATETRIRVIAPTGQITFTGTAPLIDPNAVGGVTTWRTLTGMGN